MHDIIFKGIVDKRIVTNIEMPMRYSRLICLNSSGLATIHKEYGKNTYWGEKNAQSITMLNEPLSFLNDMHKLSSGGVALDSHITSKNKQGYISRFLNKAHLLKGENEFKNDLFEYQSSCAEYKQTAEQFQEEEKSYNYTLPFYYQGKLLMYPLDVDTMLQIEPVFEELLDFMNKLLSEEEDRLAKINEFIEDVDNTFHTSAHFALEELKKNGDKK